MNESHKKFKAWCDQYTDKCNFDKETDHMVARMLLLSLWDFQQEKIDKLEKRVEDLLKYDGADFL